MQAEVFVVVAVVVVELTISLKTALISIKCNKHETEFDSLIAHDEIIKVITEMNETMNNEHGNMSANKARNKFDSGCILNEN